MHVDISMNNPAYAKQAWSCQESKQSIVL